MNKAKFKAAVDKAAARASEELQEMLQDVSRKIAADQREWLDKMMSDLLPPHLYEAGKHGDNLEEIEEYLRKNKIKLIFIPDSYSIRITIGDKVHSQFITKLTVDDEPIEMRPTSLGN